MGDYFRFGSVFIKKTNQTEIFLKKKLKPVQTDRFRFGLIFYEKNWCGPVLALFGFLGKKTGSNQPVLVF